MGSGVKDSGVIEVLASTCPSHHQQPFSCYDTALDATETPIIPQMPRTAKYRVLLDRVTLSSHLFKPMPTFHSLIQDSVLSM